jgi:hypothetical protein
MEELLESVIMLLLKQAEGWFFRKGTAKNLQDINKQNSYLSDLCLLFILCSLNQKVFSFS